MNEKFENWLWQRIEYPLAVRLIKIGAARKRGLWRLIYALSPAMAGAVVLLGDLSERQHGFDWVWDANQPDEQDAGVEETLVVVSEMINRAPAPFGDDYRVYIAQLGALPGDATMSPERIEATRDKRSVRLSRVVKGSRWHDWKSGNGKQAVRALLEQAQPTPEAPVTVIQIGVFGRAVARTLKAWGGGISSP